MYLSSRAFSIVEAQTKIVSNSSNETKMVVLAAVPFTVNNIASPLNGCVKLIKKFQTCDKNNGLYAFYANHIADRLLLQAHHSDLTLVRDHQF
jgi:hypothetical protein